VEQEPFGSFTIVGWLMGSFHNQPIKVRLKMQAGYREEKLSFKG
jgi:hypothetical protein